MRTSATPLTRIGAFRTSKYLPRSAHVATQQVMRGQFTSLLVLIGLLFGLVVMPTIAHASSTGPVHGGEMLAVEAIEEAGHSHSQGADKDIPCHTTSHHHCSMAAHFDAPRVEMNTLAKRALVHPAASAPLVSRSQAPPLDPPLA